MSYNAEDFYAVVTLLVLLLENKVRIVWNSLLYFRHFLILERDPDEPAFLEKSLLKH